ncbi:MAG: DUF5367 family protein [Balneola sp.]
MKQFRIITIATIIWIIGVSIYSISFYIPILEDSEFQSNILLSLGILPVVWFGAKQYYKANSDTIGYWLGLAFFFTAAVLDALITVPLLIIPYGGTYYSFFTAAGFWLIGMEFILVTTVYWYSKVKVKREMLPMV